jgi:hypothetical protein
MMESDGGFDLGYQCALDLAEVNLPVPRYQAFANP